MHIQSSSRISYFFYRVFRERKEKIHFATTTWSDLHHYWLTDFSESYVKTRALRVRPRALTKFNVDR